MRRVTIKKQKKPVPHLVSFVIIGLSLLTFVIISRSPVDFSHRAGAYTPTNTPTRAPTPTIKPNQCFVDLVPDAQDPQRTSPIYYVDQGTCGCNQQPAVRNVHCFYAPYNYAIDEWWCQNVYCPFSMPH